MQYISILFRHKNKWLLGHQFCQMSRYHVSSLCCKTKNNSVSFDWEQSGHIIFHTCNWSSNVLLFSFGVYWVKSKWSAVCISQYKVLKKYCFRIISVLVLKMFIQYQVHISYIVWHKLRKAFWRKTYYSNWQIWRGNSVVISDMLILYVRCCHPVVPLQNSIHAKQLLLLLWSYKGSHLSSV